MRARSRHLLFRGAAVAALLVLLMFAVIAAVVVLVLVESFIALAVGYVVALVNKKENEQLVRDFAS